VDSDGNIYVYSGENLYSFSSEGYLRWQYQGLSNGYALNGISIGIDGSLFISTLSDFYCFSYGGFFKWSMNILQYNSGISTIPTSDINGYSFLAIDNTDVEFQDWIGINFIIFDQSGGIYKKLSVGDHRHTADSTPCIVSGVIYGGTSGTAGSFLYSIK
jgi:hypothetical protein